MNAMVIVPTYNERDNIARLLGELLACDSELHIVVVDDHSPDGTGDIAEAWSGRDHRVHVIHRPAKLGLGTAYAAGFRYALSEDAEKVLTMDADFSHHPRFVPEMLRKAREADVVIGSRYVRGGRTHNCPYRRKLLSRIANRVAKTLLGLRTRDCTAGFRCYRADVLRAIDFEAIRSNGYSYLIEMLYAVQNNNYIIAEIAIVFEDRRFGTSKISTNEIWHAIQTVMWLANDRLRHALLRLSTGTSQESI